MKKIFLTVLIILPLFGFGECTAMSPSECDTYKNDLLSKINEIVSLLDRIKVKSDEQKARIDELKAYIGERDILRGDLYGFRDSVLDQLLNPAFDDTYANYSDEEFTDAFWYFFDNLYERLTFYSQELIDVQEDNFFHYIDSLSLLSSEQSLMTSSLSDVSTNNIDKLKLYVNTLDCSSCVDGGGGDTNGTCSASCPCKEYLENILDAVEKTIDELKIANTRLNDIKTKLDNIKKSIDDFKTAFDKFSEKNLEALSVISNSAYRIDVYVNDDLKKAMEIISNNIVKLQKDLRSIVPYTNEVVATTGLLTRIEGHLAKSNYYFDSFSNTLNMAEIGDLPDQIGSIFDGELGFNNSDYSTLSWWSRIELLLGRIAGVGPSTNALTSVDEDEFENNIHSISNAISSLSIDQQAEDFSTFFDSIQDVASHIKNIVPSSPTPPTDGILMIPEEYWIPNHSVSMKIDPEVLDWGRTISSLLWTVSAFVLGFKMIVTFWIVLMGSLNTILKVVFNVVGNP